LPETNKFFEEERRMADDILVSDFSRGELLRFGAGLSGPIPFFARRFSFPEGTSERPPAHPDVVFGIDVSHYEGRIAWQDVPEQAFRFVYAKASQGETLVDDQFKNNWTGLGQVAATKTLLRGAYHFLSADGDPQKQAKRFSDQVGKLDKPFDLPPCLDLEWDFHTVGGQQVDSWTHLTAQQIVDKVKTCADSVEAATGRTPIIYTNASFFKDRVGNSSALNKFRIWIADYATHDLSSDTPASIPSYTIPIWQFTDKAVLSKGGPSPIDANVFFGTLDELRKQFTPQQA
jgi:lysozyme